MPWAENWYVGLREEDVFAALAESPKFQAQEMIGAPEMPGPDLSVNDAVAAAGAGSATHLGCVVLNYVIGINITHVPYRGTGPAMHDLQGGRIDFLCEIVSTAKPHIDGGTVKPIAMMTKQRSPALPNVPTAAEQGTNVEAYTWNAIFLPKGAPDAVVKKLHDAALAAMHTPAVKERLEGLGAVIVPDDHATPQYLGNFMKSDINKWAAPIKASGASAD